MSRKIFLSCLVLALLFIGSGCGFNLFEKQKKSEEKLSIEEILEEDVFVRDQEILDIDGDGEEETIVLYIEDWEILEDKDLYCGNLSGEKLLGTFYLGLIKDNKLKSKIELLIEALENGGEFGKKELIIPKDLNGDSEKGEFAFATYASCNGDYIEVVSYNSKTSELERFKFYKEDQILEELFVSYINRTGLEFENGYLIQEYYTVTPPYGVFENHYEWNEEKQAFDFVENIIIESME